MTFSKTSFSGHEKFECKTSWLPLAYRNVDIMNGKIEAAMSLAGIGSNKVKSLRQWGNKFTLFSGTTFTDEANLIFSKDPYLEKLDSLWILHSYLTQNVEKATLYYLFFNHFFLSTFTRESLLHKIEKWCLDHKINMSTNTLDSDVTVLSKMYLGNDEKNLFSSSVFHDLNILHQVDNELIVNVKNPAALSDEAFLYIFLYFTRDHRGKTLSVKDLQYGQKSLQYTLCLTEEKLLEKLEKLGDLTSNQIIYQEAAGIKQIYINQKPTLREALAAVYKEHAA